MRIAVLLLLLLASLEPAMSATKLEPIPQDFDPARSTDCPVVGRFDYLREGKPSKPHGKVGAMGTPTLTFKNDDTGQSYRVILKGPSWSFYVALPSGKYEVTNLVGGNLQADPPVEFEVPPCDKKADPAEPQATGCSLCYLGLLRFVRSKSFSEYFKAGPESIPGRWEVEDESEKAMEGFKEAYPRLSCAGRTSLFRVQKP